jgi:tetratricopeptide (TPR) repeat protein
MKKNICSLAILFLVSITSAFAQKDTAQKTTLTPQQAKELMQQIKLDTSAFLRVSADLACKCIDSVALLNKKHDDYIEAISTCIDNEVTGYIISLKIYHSMVDTGANKNIIINPSKNSNEYKLAYYEIESWLKDSCKSLNRTIGSNNDQNEHSFSSDDKALDFYNKGIEELNKDDFKAALPYFEKAVKRDDKFAFAWDNIGVCNRQLGNYDAAITAYKKSLTLDPKGKTALQNIPVAYEFKKEYDKALEAYLNILNFYPGDPEADYGAGRIYLFFKNDDEKALQYMCKAYNTYVSTKSPYRADAEKQISYIYGKMKTDGKEEVFNRILKENNISTN